MTIKHRSAARCNRDIDLIIRGIYIYNASLIFNDRRKKMRRKAGKILNFINYLRLFWNFLKFLKFFYLALLQFLKNFNDARELKNILGI